MAESKLLMAESATAREATEASASIRTRAIAFMANRHRLHWLEALPWVLALAAYFLLPDRMTFGTQTLIMVMFALSLDLILGYAGIVTLGHAAFFGVGAYTVALLASRYGWGEPITALIASAAVAALVGFASGWLLLRYRGLALLVLTLATTIMLQEIGNLFPNITGGYDGIPGLQISPLFGVFQYDLYSHTIISIASVLFVLFLWFEHCVFTVWRSARRHSRECRAHARHRVSGARASRRGLYDRSRDCGCCRRAICADQRLCDARRL